MADPGSRGRRWRIWKSFRLRIALLFAAVSGIPCFAVKEVAVRAYEKSAVSRRTAEVREQCAILEDQTAAMDFSELDYADVPDAVLTQFSNIYNGRVMIIDDDYQIVLDTFGSDEGKTMIAPDVITCLSGNATSFYDAKEQYIDVTVPVIVTIGEEDHIKGAILASVSTDFIYETADELRGRADIVCWMSVLFIAVAGVLVADRMCRPFGRIAERMDEVTEGYDSEFMHEDAYSETEDISNSFNRLLGRMKVVNDSREEFVANVSHELKTPLTSMKVLADSLLSQEDVPVPLYREFMEDITREVDRETKIIGDLLDLVKTDRTSVELNIVSENINELIGKILRQLEPIARQKNVDIIFESFRTVTAEVDEVKFTLAVTNLVENAIKYNTDGGWVQVSLNSDHKYFYVKVADSGIGIPEREYDNIFERFYRVDKSRSREVGGTGLGLAIVRKVIVMHRGAVKVHSEEGVGTVFTVRVPLNHVV